MNNVILFRGNSSDNDLLSSLGADIKETRITGFLAYLIYQRPKELLNTFKIEDHRIISVRVEYALETQRCDIVVETEKIFYIIEAKLFFEDPIPQLIKQKKELAKKTDKKIVLIGITNNKFIRNNKILILNWQNIYEALEGIKITRIKILSEEFKMHLTNKGLASIETPEIYARELGHENSILLFLKAHCYTAGYPKSSQIEKCRYFAPHFGQNITNIIPGINHGVSYITKIIGFEIVDNRKDWEKIIYTHLKSNKLISKFPESKKVLKSVRYDFNKPHIILLLNKPHLVFNPPIQKQNLQGGAGWLSKQYYTFEELFQASIK